MERRPRAFELPVTNCGETESSRRCRAAMTAMEKPWASLSRTCAIARPQGKSRTGNPRCSCLLEEDPISDPLYENTILLHAGMRLQHAQDSTGGLIHLGSGGVSGQLTHRSVLACSYPLRVHGNKMDAQHELIAR